MVGGEDEESVFPEQLACGIIHQAQIAIGIAVSLVLVAVVLLVSRRRERIPAF